MKKVSKPKEKFGVLSSLRVINAASSIAGPFAASLWADWGADVIWIENPRMPELTRGNISPQDNRRNQRNISLDTPSEEGRKVLFKLIETADVLLESGKGGTWAKWGLTDEVLWEHNPSLVILHLSGYGQYGDPDFVRRVSYDAIGQAFSCYMTFNGYPDRPAVPAMPWTGDFIPPLLSCAAGLAAVIKARETGEGESIDMATYEALLRVQNAYPLDYLNNGIEQDGTKLRPGDRGKYSCWGNYECKDDRVYVCTMGARGTRNLVEMLGIEWDDELFPTAQWVEMSHPGGRMLDEKFTAWMKEHTVDEADKILSDLGVATSPIMTYQRAVKHPHYIAREDFIEWDALPEITDDLFPDGKIRGTSIIPKFKQHPGKVVRATVTAGYDNEEILHEIGYTDEQIQALYDSGTIATNDVMQWG